MTTNELKVWEVLVVQTLERTWRKTFYARNQEDAEALAERECDPVNGVEEHDGWDYTDEDDCTVNHGWRIDVIEEKRR
jgi:hypothetical protein